MTLAAGANLCPYEIIAPIGKGGMGGARGTRLGREVAVKVSAERFSKRVEREARAIPSLNHPHICTLYDIGPNYLVMELIRVVPVTGPLPLDEALPHAVEIADALGAAHSQGSSTATSNIPVGPSGVKLLDPTAVTVTYSRVAARALHTGFQGGFHDEEQAIGSAQARFRALPLSC